jgi:hypothetical protein
MPIPDLAQAAGGPVQRLLPAGLPEIPVDLLGKDDLGGLGRPLAPDQGFSQAVWVMDIVKSIPALDTQAAVVGRTVAAIDISMVVSLTLKVRRQPTPQYGQVDATCLSGLMRPTLLAGISAPVGQAWTHSPQATQVLIPMGSPRSKTISAWAPRKA